MDSPRAWSSSSPSWGPAVEGDVQAVAGGVGGAAAVIALLVWAVKRLIEGGERRQEQLAAAILKSGEDTARAIRESGAATVAAVGELGRKVDALGDDLAEVKANTRHTADRIDAIALATGDVTPPPRAPRLVKSERP